ncbi:MAG: hypothetical protein WDN44_00175 [Sphingomonas sp.]
MIRDPLPEELTILEARTTEEHADWIWNGLFGYIFDGLGRSAFPGAEPFIEQVEGGLASDLGQLFLKLDRPFLDRVRVATAGLLQKADFRDAQEVVVAGHLLQLGANIKALGLPAIIARKRLTIPSNAVGQQLFATAFDIATQAGFREPHDTVHCLRQLVESPLFPPGWIGRALVGMTRAEPEQFSDHFVVLRERMNTAYRIEPAKWFTATETRAERVAVVRQIARILGDDQTEMLAHPLIDGDTDGWWLQSLEDPRLASVRERVDRVIGDPEPVSSAPIESSGGGNAVAGYETVEEFLEGALV